jgi:uncharacterized membrane protein YhhN
MITVKGLLRIFILLSILYLGAILFNSITLVFYLKPALLLPLIVAAFITTNFKNKIILVVALVFSWIGDTLLLFVFKDAVYFILGLIAFLIAHIFYIVLFTKELKKANGKIELRKRGLLLIVIYLIALLLVLTPHLGSLTIPVIIYAVVISTVLYMACLLSFHWPKPASFYLFTGAISFILSDSILAVNKFYRPVPMSGFLIMATYLYAQWALVRSCIK